MFCCECRKPAQGKFCSHCGVPIAIAETAVDVTAVELVRAWDREVQYKAIQKFPGVRETVERHAQQARKRMTGEQFLRLADTVVPLGVPLEGLAALAQPLYARLGIKTGKERARHVLAPVDQVIVRALCSLARHGQTLRGVTQASDGCLFEATLPSDLFSLEGVLLVSVRRSGSQAEVCGATRISGQFYDWGKSNRCLDELFTDLTREAA
jgi:hypothetical protein